MKRSVISLLLLLMLLALPLGAASAYGGEYVMDEAGILTEEEAAALEREAARISGEQDCGLYFIAVEDYTAMNGESAYACAKDLYRDRELGWGEGKDGQLLLLSMSNRKFAIAAYGDYGNAVFTDQAKDGLDGVYLDNFRQDDWYGGVSDYLAECERLLQAYALPEPEPLPVDPPEAPYVPGTGGGYTPVPPLRGKLGIFFSLYSQRLLLAIGAACAVSLIACLVMKGRMRSVRQKPSAAAYVLADRVRFRVSEDSFTHRTESRTRIQSDNDTSSGDSGGGGGGTTVDSDGFSGHDGDF